jgi:hypothetical protein
MKIQIFIYDFNSFLAVCYLGTLNSKTRRPTEIMCSTINSYNDFSKRPIELRPFSTSNFVEDTCTIFGMSAKMDYFHRSYGSPFYCFFAIIEEDIATNR